MTARKPSTESQIAASSDDALDHREALYHRLILTQPADSHIAALLHARLCEVRLAQFNRS